MRKYRELHTLFGDTCSAKGTNAKKSILIALDWTRPKDPPSSLGHASILTHLRANGIFPLEKSWSVNHADFDVTEVTDYILQHQSPGVDVALGAFVWNERYLQQIIRTLKQQKFPGNIILGGPQVSYQKSDIEQFYPDADVFVRGYAEEAFLKYLQSPEKKPVITGIHYAGEPDLGVSATNDIELLASPYLNGTILPQPFIRWETQRGCPFKCSFCQHRESDVFMKRRYLAEDRISKEIDWIIANPIISDIAVLDPTFNSGPQYMSILQKFLKKGYTGKLSLQCRMEMATPEFLDIVEALNKQSTVVLEFGLQTIHKDEQHLINRPNNMRRVNQVLNETYQRDIPTEVSLIFGLPNQTLQSFLESVEYCKEKNVPTIYAFPLMLLRGTPLYDQKKSLGLVESTDININVSRVQQDIPHVVASNTFTFSEWNKMAAIAESLDEYNLADKKSYRMT